MVWSDFEELILSCGWMPNFFQIGSSTGRGATR